VIVKRVEAERRVSSIKRAPKWKKWFLLSADGTKNLGGYQTKREAWEEMVQTMGHEEARSELRHLRRMLPKVRREGTIRQEQGMETMIDVLQRKVGNLSAENPGRKKLYIYPNKSSIKAAQRGLRAREKAPKSKKGGLDAMQAAEQGIGSGVLRARDIIAGKRINAYQVKAFFDRHQGNYYAAVAKGLRPEESRAIQAWLVWGGDPLYRQVKRAVERDKKGLEPLKKNVTKPKKNPYREGERWKYEGQDPAHAPPFEHVGEEAKPEGKLKKALLDPLRRRKKKKEREAAWKPKENPRAFWDKAHDWNQVLIVKNGKKRTRGDILEYYKRNVRKIWPFLKGQTVMVILGAGRNDFVLRRKGPDDKYIKLTKLEGIDDPHSFEYWIHRRTIEFHPVITGKTTKLVWIDVDPYRGSGPKVQAKMQREIRKAVPTMKALLRDEFGVKRPYVWRSGKRDGGWHIEGDLPRAMNVDKLRIKLRKALDEWFAGSTVFTTTIARPGQVRLDTTLTKTLGSLRAPYSYTVDGEQKLPVKVPGFGKKLKKTPKKNPRMTEGKYEELKARAEEGKGRHVWLDYDPIGVGGTRQVYHIMIDDREEGPDEFIMKIDWGKEMFEQNKWEINCIRKGGNPLMPELYDYDDENWRWLEMEVLEPLKKNSRGFAFFEELSGGIAWDDFEAVFEDQHEVTPQLRKEAMKIAKSRQAKTFVNNVFDLAERCEHMPTEYHLIENWGVDPDATRLKVLDLGM
jgi:hypothetical protein